MSKANDGERREIARKLRELADYCDENEMSLANDDWPGILSDYIWPKDSGYHIYDEDCRRLADLIEPEPERTCRDVGSGDKFVCSKCGASLDYEGHWDEPTYWADDVAAAVEYCPHCGAGVIYDGA